MSSSSTWFFLFETWHFQVNFLSMFIPKYFTLIVITLHRQARRRASPAWILCAIFQTKFSMLSENFGGRLIAKYKLNFYTSTENAISSKVYQYISNKVESFTRSFCRNCWHFFLNTYTLILFSEFDGHFITTYPIIRVNAVAQGKRTFFEL